MKYLKDYAEKFEFFKRAAGIEPASSAWKAEVLPLNYARKESVRIKLKSTLSIITTKVSPFEPPYV
tara:strand:+ start:2444 stop:2641 length:198 start_codon:yes stop_codon:yes gene_type:complete